MSSNKRHLYPKNWLVLRVVILIRDRFTCTICGRHQSQIYSRKGKLLSLGVMHLDGNTFNNLYTLTGSIFSNPLNNLATGCPPCHSLYDKQLGNKKNILTVKNSQIIDIKLL